MTKDKFNELVSKAKNGNNAAFDAVYMEFYPKMLFVAERVTRNRDDAADAVQQAVAKFWKYVIFRCDPYIEYPYAYLYSVVKSCAIDIAQGNKRRKHYIESEISNADNEYEDNEIIKIDIKTAIGKLKEPEQTVAIQFFLFDMKLKEIALDLEEPVGTIKWRIRKIKNYFKKFLE